VAEIEPAPTSGTTTSEYPVRIELSATEGPVRIGMTAALNILVARKENVVLVPNWALRLDPNTGEIFVMVQRADGPTQVPVTLGLRNETHSEVLSGLKSGDVVGIVVTPEAPSAPGFFGGGG
jgi:HlyD family secretion protein